MELFHQCGHVADVRAAKPVDALVVVADGKYRRVVAGNQFQPGVLQLVGVLELVNENVIEAFDSVGAGFRCFAAFRSCGA